MALLCPKCGQHEISPQQPRCPGGCDLTDYWAKAGTSSAPQSVPVAMEAVPQAIPAGEAFCPGCRAPLNPDAQFCDHCGWPVVPHCPNCGADNRIGAQFCRSCGVRLSGTRPERRGRTRFCPTCGQPMAGHTGGRRTETMPLRAVPRLPTAETVIPHPPAEPVPETPPAASVSEPPIASTVEMVPVEQAVPVLESQAVGEPPVEQSAAEQPTAGQPVVQEPPVLAEEERVVETIPIDEMPEVPARPREFELAVVRRDGSSVIAFALKEGDNLIGVKVPGSAVAPAVDLGPCDPRKVISRRHAILRVIGERMLLADCGSTNGTEVNGEPITKKPVEVTTDTEIAFAGLRCRLRAKEQG